MLTKFISVVLVLGSLSASGDIIQSDKSERVAKGIKLLSKMLPAGTYVGQTKAGDKCAVTVETSLSNGGKETVDYDVSLAIRDDRAKKTYDFNLFNDGRDFSESWVVEFKTIKTRRATIETVKILEERVDDDNDLVSSKSSTLTVGRDEELKKVTVVEVNNLMCQLK